jgi:succinate dehydrogenase flavin-adding protein (antitoxin of CptAB toxin-antitoxin module)
MDEDLKRRLWSIFKGFGEAAATMTHYDLAEETEGTDIDSDTWRQFLNETDVLEWINAELNIKSRTELSKMLQGISDSHSTGQAQLLAALQKTQTTDSAKTGPAFIYCYIPLNEQQAQAPNVRILDQDPFETVEEELH